MKFKMKNFRQSGKVKCFAAKRLQHGDNNYPNYFISWRQIRPGSRDSEVAHIKELIRSKLF